MNADIAQEPNAPPRSCQRAPPLGVLLRALGRPPLQQEAAPPCPAACTLMPARHTLARSSSLLPAPARSALWHGCTSWPFADARSSGRAARTCTLSGWQIERKSDV